MVRARADDRSVSIVVPTFNRRDRLARLLHALDGMYESDGPFEVVVMVDGASDGTEEMLRTQNTSYPLRVLIQPNGGPAAARNRAIEAAAGAVVLFIDDDVVPAKGMIGRHLAIHQRDERAIVIGTMIEPPGLKLAPWLRWEAAMLRKQYDAMLAGLFAPTARQFYTANASVRREHLLASGGFDETFTRAEDVELAYRLQEMGLRFYFDAEAAVLHEPDRTFTSWLKVGYEYGRHDVRLWREKGRGNVLRALRAEYPTRHPLNRGLTLLCLGHRRRYGIAVRLLAAGGYVVGSLGVERAARLAYSGLFTLAYHQGWADMIGGRRQFWRLMSGATFPSTPAGESAEHSTPA